MALFNTYSLMTSRAVAEGLRRDFPGAQGRRVFTLTRSSFAGRPRRKMLFSAQIPYAQYPKFSPLCSNDAQLCPIMRTTFLKLRRCYAKKMPRVPRKRPKKPKNTQNSETMPEIPGVLPEFSICPLCRK